MKLSENTRLFARGAGAVIDLFPRCSAFSVGEGLSFDRSDLEALEKDWVLVSRDFNITCCLIYSDLDASEDQDISEK